MSFEEFLIAERNELILRIGQGRTPGNLTRREFSIVIVERFFSEREPDEREHMRGQLYDLLGHVQESLEAARPVLDALRTTIGDLEHLCQALDRQQPHGDRMISGQTLSIIGGVLPRSLRVTLPGHREDSMGICFTKPPSAEESAGPVVE